MKHIIAVCLLLWVFVISGCTSTDTLSQDELFDKKQECNKIIPLIQDRIDKNDTNNRTYQLIETFYSTKENDCLWILREDFDWSEFSQKMYFLNKSWNDRIEWNINRCLQRTYFNDNSKDINNCDWFNEEIKELKWE